LLPYCSANFNYNKFSVEVRSPLLDYKLKIFKGFYTINRSSDNELFNKKGQIIFDGKALGKIQNDYGENDFLIVYDDTYYFQFRHFKTWNRQVDAYDFKLSESNDTIFIEAKISGTDPMKFKRPMNLISQSKSLNCNTPIHEAGGVYNMIELSKKE
jgi:hypothetical protein